MPFSRSVLWVDGYGQADAVKALDAAFLKAIEGPVP